MDAMDTTKPLGMSIPSRVLLLVMILRAKETIRKDIATCVERELSSLVRYFKENLFNLLSSLFLISKKQNEGNNFISSSVSLQTPPLRPPLIISQYLLSTTQLQIKLSSHKSSLKSNLYKKF